MSETTFVEDCENPNNTQQNAGPTLFQENYATNGTTKSIIQFVNPIEIIPSGIILVPIWLLVLSVLSIIAISIIFSGAIFVYTTPRPGHYSESCQSRSCFKGLNLKCIDNICTCSTDQYYAKGCHNKKSYLGNCPGNSTFCLNNTDLICKDGVCKCSLEEYWDGSQCLAQKTYGSLCSQDSNCKTDLLLSCDSRRRTCLCKDDRYWDQTVCYPRLGYNEKCPNSSATFMCKLQGTSCSLDSAGVDYKCQCSQFQYFNNTAGRCKNQVAFNSTCSYDEMCQYYHYGVGCFNGKCRYGN
jgi:hypothetical protein